MKIFLQLIFSFFWVVSPKRIILLPFNSELCQNSKNDTEYNKYYELQDFKLDKQVNIETSTDIDSAYKLIKNETYRSIISFRWGVPLKSNELVYYACKVMIQPFGNPIQQDYGNAEYNFWCIRAQVTKPLFNGNCMGNLRFKFRRRDKSRTSIDPLVLKQNISCDDHFPKYINSTYKKLFISYYAPKFIPFDQTFAFNTLPSNGFVINITSFIYFNGAFEESFKQQLCYRQYGFWCGSNATNSPPAACIYGEMMCDEYDSCFDGGSDEAKCPKGNLTDSGIDSSTANSSWSGHNSGSGGLVEYLPWLALAVLPLVLLMALVCICNQQRSDAYFEDGIPPIVAAGHPDLNLTNTTGEYYEDGEYHPDKLGMMNECDESCYDEEQAQMMAYYEGDECDTMDDEDVDEDECDEEETMWTGINVTTNDNNTPQPALNSDTPMKEMHTVASPSNKDSVQKSHTQDSITTQNYDEIDEKNIRAVNACNVASTSSPSPYPQTMMMTTNLMTQSQMTEGGGDYDDDCLVDVGSLLRKINDTPLISDNVRQIITKQNDHSIEKSDKIEQANLNISASTNENPPEVTATNDKTNNNGYGTYDYRSDYIVV